MFSQSTRLVLKNLYMDRAEWLIVRTQRTDRISLQNIEFSWTSHHVRSERDSSLPITYYHVLIHLLFELEQVLW